MKIFSEEDIGKSFKITVSNSMGSDDITVSVKNIVDLIIETPAKTTYQLFDNLELTGIRVYGVYDDDTIEGLFNYEVDESDFNTHILDKPVCDIKILYGDIEKSFEVNVLEEIGVNGDSHCYMAEFNAFSGTLDLGNSGSSIGANEVKYIVDWGDGSVQRFNGNVNCNHNYSVNESRIVKVYFNKRNVGSGGSRLKRVLRWSDYPFYYSFYSCSNLLSLPENQSMKYNTSISINFGSTFNGCSSLMAIPENLFDDISFFKVVNVASIFYGCSNLTLIPSRLFKNFISLNKANSAFSNSGIVSVGDDLFCNSILLSNVYAIFQNCKSLSTIPENLFINNVNLIDCSYGFNNCKNLTLPTNLFNTAALQSKEPKFYGCFAVDNSIDSPTGMAYPLWNNITLSSRGYCYQNCSGLANFSSIPLFWK